MGPMGRRGVGVAQPGLLSRVGSRSPWRSPRGSRHPSYPLEGGVTES